MGINYFRNEQSTNYYTSRPFMILDEKITSINSEKHMLIKFKLLNMQFMITNWNKGLVFYRWNDNQWKVEDIDPGFVLISVQYTENKDSAAYLANKLLEEACRRKLNHLMRSSILRCLLSLQRQNLQPVKQGNNMTTSTKQ